MVKFFQKNINKLTIQDSWNHLMSRISIKPIITQRTKVGLRIDLHIDFNPQITNLLRKKSNKLYDPKIINVSHSILAQI